PRTARRAVRGSAQSPRTNSMSLRTSRRFSRRPAKRSSRTRIRWPRATSACVRWLPMNPAPPVTRMLVALMPPNVARNEAGNRTGAHEARRGLVCVLLPKPPEQRENEDLAVEQQRPGRDVVEVDRKSTRTLSRHDALPILRWLPMTPAPPVTRMLVALMPPNVARNEAGNRTGAHEARRGLVCVLLPKPPEQRENEDLDVEQQRPVLDVVEVVLDPLLDRGVPPPAVDLRPARDAALHAVAQPVLGDALLELLHEGRPLRPRADEAHVAEHHVDELGELVEVEAAQPDPDRGAPRILRRGPHRTGVLLRIVHHGPELVDLERLPIQGHALLAEQD